MGHLARMAQRVLGLEGAVRPAIDRWHVARAPEANRASIAAFSFDEPVAATRPVQAAAPRSTDGRAGVRQSHDSQAIVEAVTPTAVIATPQDNKGRPAVKLVAQPGARVAPESTAERDVLAAGAMLEIRSEHRGREARLLPAQPVAPHEAARRSAGAFENAHKTVRPDEPGPVYVHIGRIDVRAVDAPAPRAPQAAARTAIRKPSLEAHLRARDRGAG